MATLDVPLASAFTPAQHAIVDRMKRVASTELQYDVPACDAARQFSREHWRTCAATGILGLPIPEAYGGAGQSMLTTALAIKTLSRHCADEGLVFSLCAHLTTCALPIALHGTEEQKRTYLPGLINGTIIGGNGATETDAGSDVTGMQTRVEKRDGHYVLNGTKRFVTNGAVADILLIFASHGDGLAAANLSVFLIDMRAASVRVATQWETMGLRTASLAEIVLENCTVPANALVGRERRALYLFNDAMLWERVLMAAYHIGAMELQFNAALHHCRTRTQFGRPIISFQYTAGKLVDMRRQIDTSTPLLVRACQRHAEGTLTMGEASMLKLHVSEGKIANSLRAVQLFGGSGYLVGSLVERQLRDSIAATIYSGTSEIQKGIVADGLEDYV